MSGCAQGGRAVPNPPMRITVEFANGEKPWSYPMALNGREVVGIDVSGIPSGVPVTVGGALYAPVVG